MVTVILLWRPCRGGQKADRKERKKGVVIFSRFNIFQIFYICSRAIDVPGAVGMCHGKAFLLCGPPLQGCNWKDIDENKPHLIYSKREIFVGAKFPIIIKFMSSTLNSMDSLALDALQGMTLDTHSPLASSSQISKNTMRSYLQWRGPACGRVMAVSLVAGTVLKRKIERLMKENGLMVQSRLMTMNRELGTALTLQRKERGKKKGNQWCRERQEPLSPVEGCPFLQQIHKQLCSPLLKETIEIA